MRNASEANEIMIFGIDLKPGDEVIVDEPELSAHDHVVAAARAPRRDRAQADLVQGAAAVATRISSSSSAPAITPRTKVIEVTHITNLTGQIMPVRDIVRMARPLGIEVLVDGAHAFNHFPFKRDDLECDYYGMSLHKWTLAPIGVGIPLRAQEQDPEIWSLMGVGRLAQGRTSGSSSRSARTRRRTTMR